MKDKESIDVEVNDLLPILVLKVTKEERKKERERGGEKV